MNSFSDNTITQRKDTSRDELIRHCWKYQDCNGCLEETSCGWCPSSTTCIPNTNKIQILAPIWDADICPLWSERWELRARPFGCHVSTITFLTCVVSVLSTFVVIGSVALGVKATRKLKILWTHRGHGWWKLWRVKRPTWWVRWRTLRPRTGHVQQPPEEEALLG